METASAVDRLLARVQALVDIDAIETLKARYWRAIDGGRVDDAGACLLADAVIDFEGLPRFASRDAFLEVVRAAAARAGQYGMHHGHHPHIEMTGPDSARGTWEIHYHGVDLPGRVIVHMAGAYSDTYERQGGRWFIASSIMRQTSMSVYNVDAAGLLRARH